MIGHCISSNTGRSHSSPKVNKMLLVDSVQVYAAEIPTVLLKRKYHQTKCLKENNFVFPVDGSLLLILHVKEF